MHELRADTLTSSVISRYLNTMSGHAVCTVGFAAVGTLISFICSLPRTFDTLSKLATLSAFFTLISVVLAAVFAGIEDHPAGFNPDPNHVNEKGVKMGGNPLVLVVPAVGTTFVSGMNAFLNISYTFIGQITLPSFIAEMKNPYDFRKALWLVTIAEIIVFSLVGAGKHVLIIWSILSLTFHSRLCVYGYTV
jgi:Transmembrane amino acid transporter protein